ncbi:hypothetical protein J6590_053989 [Homalodisca vitripennis]|nr:hypothetical protein J6590_053989 [Homalodisca vitripennis]
MVNVKRPSATQVGTTGYSPFAAGGPREILAFVFAKFIDTSGTFTNEEGEGDGWEAKFIHKATCRLEHVSHDRDHGGGSHLPLKSRVATLSVLLYLITHSAGRD